MVVRWESMSRSLFSVKLRVFVPLNMDITQQFNFSGVVVIHLSFEINHSYSVDITVTFDSEESVILNDD